MSPSLDCMLCKWFGLIPKLTKDPYILSPVLGPLLICQDRAPRDKVCSSQCHCSQALTNQDRWRHFSVFVNPPLPPAAPPWHRSETRSGKSSHAPPFFITQYYCCLKPCCLATKCFSTALLFWLFSVFPTPPPSVHTQVSQELHHWNAFKISHGSS